MTAMSGPGVDEPLIPLVRHRPMQPRTAVLALLAAGYLAAVQPLTWPATVGVIVAGVIVLRRGLTLAREDRDPPPPPLPRLGLIAWWTALLAFGVLEVTNDLLGSTPEHPTLSILLDPMTSSRLGRFVGVIVWIVFGDYLIHR